MVTFCLCAHCALPLGTCCLLDACALNCALLLRCQQQQQAAIDHDARLQQSSKTADPSRRTTAHTDWRGLLLGVVVSPQPNSVVCPETKKTTEALIVTRCLVQQISTTNWIMSHFSLSRPENCETRAYAVAGGRGLKKQPCTSHSPDRHWGGRWAECHFQPVSAGRKAGATDPTGPTNQTIHPLHLSPGENLASGPGWLGLAHKWGSGKHLVRRSSASLTKLMQAHSLFLVYPSERSLHTHTPEGRKRQKDPRKKHTSGNAQKRTRWAGPIRE